MSNTTTAERHPLDPYAPIEKRSLWTADSMKSAGYSVRLADPNARETRDNSVLDWDALDQPAHAALLALHTALLAVRQTEVAPLLPFIGGNAGSFTVLREDSDGTGALQAEWRLADGRVLVLAANLSDTPVTWQSRGRPLFRLGNGDGLPGWALVLSLC